MPKYKYRNKTHNIIFIDKTRFRKKVSDENKIGLPRTKYEVTIPSNIKKEWIVMLMIKYINKSTFKINFIYNRNLKYLDELRDNKVKSQLVVSKNKALGIDLGVKNLVTCVTFGLDEEDSFIIRGSELKQRINETNDTISYL